MTCSEYEAYTIVLMFVSVFLFLCVEICLAERCNFIAMSGSCHDMLSSVCLSVCRRRL